MAFPRIQKSKPGPSSPIIFFSICIAAIALLFLFSSLISTSGFYLSSPKILESMPEDKYKNQNHQSGHEKYLYWGDKIDCPGKHCESCAGLGHQESSLRCALEEAMFLQRTFVMPSRMCLNPMHNKKAILHHSNDGISEERKAANSCSMDSLYDTDLISGTVPVILDNSKKWYQVVETSMKLEARGAAHVEGVSRVDLKENSRFSNLLIINRTASPLSWFMECKDRKNRSAIILPHSFLPSMVAKKLRNAADEIKELLGDYDAIHVRRGDILKTRKDRFGVSRTLHPHVDRDTHPEFILRRIEKWVPSGRTLYIASNERTLGFFSPLSVRYKLAYSWNYSHILEPVIENNYQLFMIERLIMMGAKTFINTFKEDDSDLSLTDDQKKNTKIKELLGDYDAIHVRRGDILKTRKDRFGVSRTLHPHVDRDTHPEFILRRIEKWVPSGRTLYIASNERTLGFFSPLSVRYKLAYSWNYSHILEPVIENNYQLFMIERLIMMDAKTFINTFKEDDSDLSLTDDQKKNTKVWQIPVYTMDEEGT